MMFKYLVMPSSGKGAGRYFHAVLADMLNDVIILKKHLLVSYKVTLMIWPTNSNPKVFM